MSNTVQTYPAWLMTHAEQWGKYFVPIISYFIINLVPQKNRKILKMLSNMFFKRRYPNKLLPDTLVDHSPATAIEPLTEQLDRRLCAVEFLCGHVDVIDEQNEFLAGGGTEHALPPLLALAID